jgi:hypothetical protein
MRAHVKTVPASKLATSQATRSVVYIRAKSKCGSHLSCRVLERKVLTLLARYLARPSQATTKQWLPLSTTASRDNHIKRFCCSYLDRLNGAIANRA